MEENNVDVKKQMGIVQTVKALIEVQAVLAKVNAQMAIKEGKIMVQSAVDDAKETIKEQKSKLGKSIEKMEEEYLSEKEDKKNVLEEYNGILGEIDDMYNEVLEGILAQRTEKETQESQIMLKENENIAEIKGLKLDEKKLREQLSKITKKEDMETIKNNQDILMERERLAGLGQLIGGIAHNLKTPIMSIAGATQGLENLIKEYDESIDDPLVNSQDHHDIARDMEEWIPKIRAHLEYMSDIITTVKGQAVASLSENDTEEFTVMELIKRVNILMKHELKNAYIYLNVLMKIDENQIIHGNVNVLVQVVNNMISNAIQAYNGKTEQNIDLILEKSNGNLIISVKDYGCGLPQKVQDKLFKEMITTKGKNGTGLGLYMSYSTIKAHFNGNITFETEEGKGTTFNIILPL